jgi:hypothetical protein
MRSSSYNNSISRPAAVAIGFVFVLSTSTFATAAHAGQNLLANGEFSDFTVLPWTDDSLGSVYLSSLDHDNNLDSGSALLVDDNGTSFYATVLRSEPVEIEGGSQVDVGGWFKGGASNPANSKLRIGRDYYSDAACTTWIAAANASYVTVPSNWTYQSHAHVAPSNARCVKMAIVAASSTSSNLDLHLDGLFLDGVQGAPSGPFFADGFEGGSTSAWVTVQ